MRMTDTPHPAMSVSTPDKRAPVMTLEAVGHAYQAGQWIFRGCNATLGKGEILAVLGTNGCGKTTLLKLLLGMMAPAEGRIQVRERCAFVPQVFQASFDYRCLDMVMMGRASRHGMFSQPSHHDEAATWAAMERLGIEHLAERSFHEISGGQRQLVIFARAIVAEASILILDEPSSALDLENQLHILRLIDQLAHDDGLSVLMTTHHPHHAFAVADQALLMFRNGAMQAGPARSVLKPETLSQLFGTPMAFAEYDYQGTQAHTLAPVLSMLERSDHSQPAFRPCDTQRSKFPKEPS